MSRFCTYCGKPLGTQSTIGLGNSPPRCKYCTILVQQQLEKWRGRLVQAWTSGCLTQHTWSALRNTLASNGISEAEAVEFVRLDALRLLEQSFALAKANGQIRSEQQVHFHWLIQEFNLHAITSHIVAELDYCRQQDMQKVLFTMPSVRDVPTQANPQPLPIGGVYLLKAGPYYKIGKSKNIIGPENWTTG
jgi:hypothetical protein